VLGLIKGVEQEEAEGDGSEKQQGLNLTSKVRR
jgi:hypothetical protein